MVKALIWDIETAPIVATTWGMFPKYLPTDNILRDWYIICGCWKWLDGKRVYAASIDAADALAYRNYETDTPPDEACVRALHKAVSEADYIVAHNGDAFDLKKLNARVIHYGLPPLPSVRTVDTLKEVRKVAKFTSNRLGWLAPTLLKDGGKIPTNYSLWLRVMAGEKKALSEMVRYCRRDVTELERIYLKLRPYMKSHPNLAMHGNNRENAIVCPKCASTKLQSRGVQRTQTQVYTRYQCQDCGGWSRASRVNGQGVLKTAQGTHT